MSLKINTTHGSVYYPLLDRSDFSASVEPSGETQTGEEIAADLQSAFASQLRGITITYLGIVDGSEEYHIRIPVKTGWELLLPGQPKRPAVTAEGRYLVHRPTWNPSVDELTKSFLITLTRIAERLQNPFIAEKAANGTLVELGLSIGTAPCENPWIDLICLKDRFPSRVTVQGDRTYNLEVVTYEQFTIEGNSYPPVGYSPQWDDYKNIDIRDSHQLLFSYDPIYLKDDYVLKIAPILSIGFATERDRIALGTLVTLQPYGFDLKLVERNDLAQYFYLLGNNASVEIRVCRNPNFPGKQPSGQIDYIEVLWSEPRSAKQAAKSGIAVIRMSDGKTVNR